MATVYWSNSTTFNSKANRGQVRWEIFKSQNADAILELNGNQAVAKDFATFDDLKVFLKAKKGSNPHSAGMTILIDGKAVAFNKVERIGGRKPGTVAQNLEALVALATLGDFKTYEEFLKEVEDDAKIQALLDKCKGISREELQTVIDIVTEEPDQGTIFINIGKNIRNSTPIGSVGGYHCLSRSTWFGFKDKIIPLVAAHIGASTAGDKWNPADIIFVKSDGILNQIPTDNLAEANLKFEELVKSGDLIPVSVKQKPNSIKGSRGIAKELDQVNSNKPIIQFLTAGQIKGIPLRVNYQDSKETDESSIQRKVLNWVEHFGIEHVEKTAGLAIGDIDVSSVWYLANDRECIAPTFGKKEPPKLKEIVISLVSKAVWFKFDKAFLVARTKGGNIQLTADNERSGKHVKDWNSVANKESLTFLTESDYMAMFPDAEMI